jgi:uncharacterized repeat protein (TIGR03803 family)
MLPHGGFWFMPSERSRSRHFVLELPILFVICASLSQAQTESVLYNFIAFPHGAQPAANLIADSAGNLYGTTSGGGLYGAGTVFEVSPDAHGGWTQQVLYSFTGGIDGGTPVAGLTLDAMGSLYGTTASGGENCYQGCGTVFKLSLSDGRWNETTLYAFSGPDGADPVASLIFDSVGNLYGTTNQGGDYGVGTVFVLYPSGRGIWSENVLVSFDNGFEGAYPQASLVFDSLGNLYGTTETGGDLNACYEDTNNGGCGIVFELSPTGDGWQETVLHAFTFNDGALPTSSLVFGKDGNLYGTTSFGPGFGCYEQGCGTVFQLQPNTNGTWTEQMIYNFKGGPDGGFPLAGVVSDNSGNLYGTTQKGGGGLFNCATSCGAVFQLTPHKGGSWTEQLIHRFLVKGGQSDDGTEPVSGLLLDSHGNLYGTASMGGSYAGYCSTGCGTAFELKSPTNGKWAVNLLYAFPAGAKGLSPTGGLIADSQQNLYGATLLGGDNPDCSLGPGCGTVFTLTPQAEGRWSAALVHTFNGKDGAEPLGALISDVSGTIYGTTMSGGGNPDCIGYDAPCGGTVFAITATEGGWEETVIHRFHVDKNVRVTDGARPFAGVVGDATGALYGTTQLGGLTSSRCTDEQYVGCGTVYKLSPTGNGHWKEELLYAFKGGTDGAGPLGGLVFGSDGELYGTTCDGGADDSGTVFELTPSTNGSWSERILYSFQGRNGSDGICPWSGMITDESGNLFGTTSEGGSYSEGCSNGGCGTVFELSPTTRGQWKETILLSFSGTDGANPQSSLVMDENENIYGAAPNSGTYFSGGTIFELVRGSNGWSEKVLHTFGTGSDGSGPNGPLLLDAEGSIYDSTSTGGTDGKDFGGTAFLISSGASQGILKERQVVRPSQPRADFFHTLLHPHPQARSGAN